LVLPIPLPEGIDTGIGNTFLRPKVFNTFQQHFCKNSNFKLDWVENQVQTSPVSLVEQLKRPVEIEIEHRSKETPQD